MRASAMVKLLAAGATCTRRTAPGSVRVGYGLRRRRCRRARRYSVPAAQRGSPPPLARRAPRRQPLAAAQLGPVAMEMVRGTLRSAAPVRADSVRRRTSSSSPGDTSTMTSSWTWSTSRLASLARLEVAVEPDQGQLEDVGRQALDARRSWPGARPPGAAGSSTTCRSGSGRTPAEQRSRCSAAGPGPRPPCGPCTACTEREGAEVALHDGGGLLDRRRRGAGSGRRPPCRRRGRRRPSWPRLALGVGHLLGRDAEDARRPRSGARPSPSAKRVDQPGVPREVGDARAARPGRSRPPGSVQPSAGTKARRNCLPVLGAHRDVVQVGPVRGDAPGAGHGLAERGVDAAVGRHLGQQALPVGRAQLLDLAVAQQRLDDRVLRRAGSRASGRRSRTRSSSSCPA